MSYKTIAIRGDGPVRTITLNRPDRRNAINPEMQEELLVAFEEVIARGSRILVLTGAGEAFSSGLDLNELRGIERRSHEEHLADAQRILRVFRALYELPIPTIAAVNGPALAGGAGLVIVCDFAIAATTARFGFTETRIGFVPAFVSAFLALQIGGRQARDLLLSARTVDAEEAARFGLINQTVPPGALDQQVRSLAETLLANSPASLSQTKRLLTAQNKPWLDAAIEAAINASAQARQTPDFHEGIAAFLEKRKPSWAAAAVYRIPDAK